MTISQDLYLRSRVDTILERCTACGKCVEVCPSSGFLQLEGDGPEAVAAGIIGLLRNGAPSAAATRFIDACSGSARCRDVCPEGIDPYDMMRLAKVRQSVLRGRRPPPSDYHLVDLSLRAQIGPKEPRWFTRRPTPAPSTSFIWAAISCGRRTSRWA